MESRPSEDSNYANHATREEAQRFISNFLPLSIIFGQSSSTLNEERAQPFQQQPMIRYDVSN